MPVCPFAHETTRERPSHLSRADCRWSKSISCTSQHTLGPSSCRGKAPFRVCLCEICCLADRANVVIFVDRSHGFSDESFVEPQHRTRNGGNARFLRTFAPSPDIFPSHSRCGNVLQSISPQSPVSCGEVLSLISRPSSQFPGVSSDAYCRSVRVSIEEETDLYKAPHTIYAVLSRHSPDLRCTFQACCVANLRAPQESRPVAHRHMLPAMHPRENTKHRTHFNSKNSDLSVRWMGAARSYRV